MFDPDALSELSALPLRRVAATRLSTSVKSKNYRKNKKGIGSY